MGKQGPSAFFRIAPRAHSGSVGRAGFTLVEVLVACACAAIFSLIFATLLNSQSMSMLSTRIANVRDNLRSVLERYIGNPGFVNQSAAYTGAGNQGNVLLNYCLNGGNGCGSANCCIDNHQGVTAGLPAVTGQPFIFLNPANGKPLTGTDAYTNANAAYTTAKAPVNYDQNGSVCTPGGPSCPIEAVTSFYATCPGGVPVGTTCAQASQVVINYTVRMSTDNTGTAGSLTVVPNPGNPLPPVSGIFQPTSDSLIPGPNTCTTGATCLQGFLPMFAAIGGTSLTDSVASQVGGEIGIGLANAAVPLSMHELEVISTTAPGFHTAELVDANYAGLALGAMNGLSSVQAISGSTNSGANLVLNSVFNVGFVGVAKTNPTYALEIGAGNTPVGGGPANGDIDIDSGDLRIGGAPICGALGCPPPSDRRLKQSIEPLSSDGSLDKLLKLQGVSYLWKDQKKYGKGTQIGLIAQDVEKVFPEIVHTDESTGLKSVFYDHLIAPVIESMKILYAKLTQHDAAIAANTDAIARLNAKLNSPSARNPASSPSEPTSNLASELAKELASEKAEISELRSENASLKAASARKDSEVDALKDWACAQTTRPAFCH